METITKITAILGAAFGLLGAVLGIMNTWKAYIRDKPHVRVKLISYIERHTDIDALAFEITNLSMFPITIEEIGVIPKKASDRRYAIDRDGFDCDFPFPCRLESRTSFTARLKPITENRIWSERPKFVYARTGCSLIFISKRLNLPS